MTRRMVLDDPGVARARAVLVNIENHVNVVGLKNIEAIELVVHGPALRTFIAKDIEPEVRGKLDTLSGVVRVMELQEAGYAYIKP
jgi:intracellular sulfur oxidation DsrE/DsrF family protein